MLYTIKNSFYAISLKICLPLLVVLFLTSYHGDYEQSRCQQSIFMCQLLNILTFLEPLGSH